MNRNLLTATTAVLERGSLCVCVSVGTIKTATLYSRHSQLVVDVAVIAPSEAAFSERRFG